MLSLPLSIVGIAVTLLTGDTVNIMSMIGLIMLMGLVTKNAILLVDYANSAARGHGAARGADQGGRDPAAADHDDDAGDDLRHAAAGLRHRRRRRDARADGPRGDRRPHHLDAADTAGRAGRLQLLDGLRPATVTEWLLRRRGKASPMPGWSLPGAPSGHL